MSTSDAAPLPRLGEVFFDVRSKSRCLRISWYADTGVAVLSIWQGGTCTGSFRLPMGDLPRLIETLQRGPDGWARPGEDRAPQTGAADPPQAARPGAAGPGAAHAAAVVPGFGPPKAGPESGSLHYLNGAAADCQEGIAGYPDAAAHYQEPAASYPDAAAAGYRAEPTPYPDEPDPARYPAGRAQRAVPAGQAGSLVPYPGDSYSGGLVPASAYRGAPDASGPDSAALHSCDAGPRDYAPAQSGIDYRQPAPLPPYRHAQPDRDDERHAADWDPRGIVPAGNGLEPLPESFPYGVPQGSK